MKLFFTLKSNSKKLFLVVILTTLISPECVFSQIQVDPNQQMKADSLGRIKGNKEDVFTNQGRKNFGNAALDFGLAEIIPWTFDRYVTKKDYARISWKSVGHNINPGSWQFDNDEFQTNQFGHPYHGSNFYSAFRANGYSFWQAAPATFAGSYLWETFAENQAPAPNDFINTSYGGIILGEMTYRLSNKIINNQTRGFKRQVDEVLGFMVNPMNGLHRITSGQWGKVSKNTAERDSSKIRAEFDFGGRQFDTDVKKGRTGWYGHIKLLYGTPSEHYDVPFSNIAINAEFGKDDSSKVNVISVYGSLAGWEISSSEKYQHLLILSANYDYIRNVSFFYGGQSAKANFFSEYNISDKLTINTIVSAGPIILGAVPDHYLFRGRDYDYGSGASVSVGGGVNLAGKLFYNVNYREAWLATISGNSRYNILHTFSNEISYYLIKNIAIAFEQGHFSLNSYYRDQPDVSSKYPYVRASVRYAVTFQ
ncbi:DUF3943 domain-containing protein [Mucilaginibacter sp. BJC16-A38]|uniref:DUF3943 domain-containing protein n=1 Tax=Mucilaginibacter phenanthrenivorans TaxID=1234842 RepID=UPI002158120C|nr:DUF3943 domain-containing protein [Mucilaginibacter phenanthrenivorans]MCR8556696.1 DUF3943 domain-containing protein [Mucilaginibacter phenanthrenivorans]